MTEAGVEFHRIDQVAIDLDPAPLAVDTRHRAEIDAIWAGESAANPALYNGRAFLVSQWRVENGTLTARCHESRFATILWLRQQDPPPGVLNPFGSCVLLTTDGAVILAEMSAVTANAGRIYFPGGILDADDLRGGRFDGTVTIRRELAEETGLTEDEAIFEPGFCVIQHGVRLAILRVARLPWTAEAAVAEIGGRIAAQPEPELSALHIVRHTFEAKRFGVPRFVQRMLDEVLAS